MLFFYLQRNVSSEDAKAPPFIRALVTVVCEGAMERGNFIDKLLPFLCIVFRYSSIFVTLRSTGTFFFSRTVFSWILRFVLCWLAWFSVENLRFLLQHKLRLFAHPMLMLGYTFNGNPVAYIVVHKPVQKQVIQVPIRAGLNSGPLNFKSSPLTARLLCPSISKNSGSGQFMVNAVEVFSFVRFLFHMLIY